MKRLFLTLVNLIAILLALTAILLVVSCGKTSKKVETPITDSTVVVVDSTVVVE